MNTKSILITLLLWAGIVAGASAANSTANSTTGVSGYDLVSYQTSKRPIRGNGHFVAVHNDVSYLFANKKNMTTFKQNPQKYLPAYGGYCAFGVSVGKKFVGDPEVWRVINGKLYLNLDTSIQDQWFKDIPGRIKTADVKWRSIKNTAPGQL